MQANWHWHGLISRISLARSILLILRLGQENSIQPHKNEIMTSKVGRRPITSVDLKCRFDNLCCEEMKYLSYLMMYSLYNVLEIRRFSFECVNVCFVKLVPILSRIHVD